MLKSYNDKFNKIFYIYLYIKIIFSEEYNIYIFIRLIIFL